MVGSINLHLWSKSLRLEQAEVAFLVRFKFGVCAQLHVNGFSLLPYWILCDTHYTRCSLSLALKEEENNNWL